MKTLISSLIFLFVFSFAGMTDLYGASQDPHNPHNPANHARQAHERAMELHKRNHNNAMEMHRNAHEQAIRNAKCFDGTDPNCIHQLHKSRPERRENGLVERFRTWRENRRNKA